MPNAIVRAEPRISVNKLGEYLVASPRRRRSIIVDQKRPKPFKTARYTEAQRAISAFLRRGSQDYARLQEALDDLRKQVPSSDWDADRINLCVEAIERFMDIRSLDQLKGFIAALGSADPPKLVLSRVSVSVRPEIILPGKVKRGSPVAGCNKFHIGK